MNKKQVLKLAKGLRNFTLDEINMLAEFDTYGILEELDTEKSLIKIGDKYQHQNQANFNIIKVEDLTRKTIIEKDLNFIEASEYFLSSYAKKLAPSTYKSYKSISKNHLVPYFKTTKIKKITREQIIEFIEQKSRENLSAKYVSNCATCLRTIFGKFYECNFIENNPYQGIIPVKIERNKCIKVLNKFEQKRILKLSKNKYPDLYPLIFLVINLGVKKSEILALQKQDFNFKNKQVKVIKKRYERQALDLKSPRTIDMQEENLSQIKSFLKENKEREYIFYNDTSRASTNDKIFRREFQKLLEELELEKMFIDELRHTYAFNVLQAGYSMDYLHKQLGDYSIQATMDRYGKFIIKRG